MKTMLGGLVGGCATEMSARSANEIIPVAAPRIRSRRVIECLSVSGMRPHFWLPSPSGDCDLVWQACGRNVTIPRSTLVTWLDNTWIEDQPTFQKALDFPYFI